MEGILLSTKTRALIDDVITNGAHGLLLIGERGAGKSYLSKIFAAQSLALPISEIEPHVHVISTGGKAISIEAIRQLQQFLYLKTVGTGKIRRIVIIEDSELLTTEAQNALLKVLEEPPADTVLLLTTSQPALLKSTILSRVQRIHVQPASLQENVAYFENKGFRATDISRAFMLANGQPGLIHALLSGNDRPLAAQIDQAKQLFTMNRYERLLAVENLSKSREEVQEFLYACKRIASSAVYSSAEKGTDQTATWQRRKKRVVEAEARMAYTPNIKLLLTDLFLNL